MTSLFALRALLFAGEMLAGSLLIMALPWLFVSQRRASARHLVWAGAFGAALVLPLLAAAGPSPLRILLPVPTPEIPPQLLNDAASAAALPIPPESAISLYPSTLALVLGGLWLAGVCCVLLRFGIGAWCLAALHRRSRPFAVAPEDQPKVAAKRRECELRLSESENGPITWGVLRPVILLPRTAVFWTRERLHAVLLHELAHIRRHDSLVQVLSLFVCALYWPNPLVWMGDRALRRESEMAADDSVIAAGVKPSSYAGELLQLAAEFRTRAPALSALSLFMAAPSALEARVESVLEPASSRTGVTAMDIARVAGLGLITAGAIALACPSLAQDATTAPTPPAVESAALPPLIPPAPEAPPAPPAPPVRAAPAAPAELADSSIRVRVSDNAVHPLTLVDIKRMRIEIAKSNREARMALEKARPEIERAVSERDAQPRIDATVASAAREAQEAMTRVRPEMERAIADANVSEHAMRAMRQAPSTKHQAPSTKHQAPSTKHQAPSTKHNLRSIRPSKQRSPNTTAAWHWPKHDPRSIVGLPKHRANSPRRTSMRKSRSA